MEMGSEHRGKVRRRQAQREPGRAARRAPRVAALNAVLAEGGSTFTPDPYLGARARLQRCHSTRSRCASREQHVGGCARLFLGKALLHFKERSLSDFYPGEE
ncbi:Hypothetical predicted protein [Marmota monax]|uniref:Uncharacterized protein n=1 Tax=Marmota monax TaxID=9995 RepID=A0A5E4A401_MARMO|nr:Hypothetical predicted protein [Marmota monax]